MPVVIAGAVLVIDDVVIAIVAALLGALLLNMMQPTIRLGLSQMPIVGQWLADNVDALISSVSRDLSGWAASSVHALTSMIIAIWTSGWNLVQGIDDALYAAYNASHRILHYAIPHAVSVTESYAQTLYGEATDYARSLVAPLSASISAALATAESYAQQLYGEAISYADSRFAQAEADAQAAASAALGTATAATAAVEAELRGIDAGLERDIASARDAAIAAAQGMVADALANLQVIDNGFASTLERIEEDIPKGLSSTLAQAIAAATAIVIPVEAAIKDIEGRPCMQNCDVLGLLGQSLGALDVLAVIGLVAAASRDPQGTTDMLNADITPLVSGAVTDASALLREAVA